MIRERTIAWSDPKLTAEAARGMAGLELMRGLLDGSVPPPPAIALVGLSLAEVEEGRIVMRLTPAEYHYNPIGSMHGGILATMLDSVMGCAVHSTLPKGRAYTSLEIKVNFVRAVTQRVRGTVRRGQDRTRRPPIRGGGGESRRRQGPAMRDRQHDLPGVRLAGLSV